jgi:hypothetical protein
MGKAGRSRVGADRRAGSPGSGKAGRSRVGAGRRAGSIAAALAAGLVLADASVVVLALPPLLVELGASVEGVAAVIGVYTLALALALPVAARLVRAAGPRVAGGAALLAFAAASLGCGLAGALTPLVVLRAVQGVAGAGVLVAAFALLDAGAPGPGRRAWHAIGVAGAAAGPALGGVLTQALDWRAIFLVQAPVLALAGLAVLAGRAPAPAPAAAPDAPATRAPRGVALAALGLVSAALTGVLFLLVLLLVTGWARSPLAAAVTVTVLPLAALAGTRIPGPDLARATAGCLLVAAGVAALAPIRGAATWLVLAPQVVAGLGMGLALPALGGGLLPERTPRAAATGLAARHLGVTLALLLIAPIAAAGLARAERDVRERGTAVILDARLPPLEKLELAKVATARLDAVSPRAALGRALDRAARDAHGEDRAELHRVARRADDALVAALDRAFAPALLACAGLALLAVLLLAAARPTALRRPLLAPAAVLAAVLLAGQAAGAAAAAPAPVVIRDPCQDRALPRTGGITGFLQDRALELADTLACKLGASREELVLALADPDRAKEFERRHGVDPRTGSGLLGRLLG